MKTTVVSAILISCLIFVYSCTNHKNSEVVTSSSGDRTKELFSIMNLVKEKEIIPDSVIRALNAQHHQMGVLMRRTLPSSDKPGEIRFYSDYIAKVEQLPVINPGPGEYVHVMQGDRHGYNNLTIGITETFPDGAPPMHSHEGEESHVLLEGEILYALADTIFTLKAPYIVNIPAGMPHAFKNIGKTTANLVVIFPTNIWKYDVLDYFPFKKDSAKSASRFSDFKKNMVKK